MLQFIADLSAAHSGRTVTEDEQSLEQQLLQVRTGPHPPSPLKYYVHTAVKLEYTGGIDGKGGGGGGDGGGLPLPLASPRGKR